MLRSDWITQAWHELFLEKEADPTDTRSVKEFADSIPLDKNTVYTWKRQHRAKIYEEVEKRRKEYITEMRQKGWKALSKRMDSDTAAIKLNFQLLGDLVEKTENTNIQMTPEMKNEKIKLLMADLKEKRINAEIKDEKAL